MSLKRRRSSPSLSDRDSSRTCDCKRQRHTNTSLSSFSDELLLQIFSFLDAPSVAQVDLVSRRFKQLSRDEVLWRVLYARDYARTSRRRTGKAGVSADGSTCETDKKRPSQRELGFVSKEDRLAESKTWRKRYQIRSNWLKGRYHAVRSDDAAGRLVGSWRVKLVEHNLSVCDPVDGLQGSLLLSAVPLKVHAAEENHLILQYAQTLQLVQIDKVINALQFKLLSSVDCTMEDDFSYANGHMATLSATGLLCTYSVAVGGARLISALKGAIVGKSSLVVRKQGLQTLVSVAFVAYGVLSDTVTVQQLVFENDQHTSTRVAHVAATTAGAGFKTAVRRSEEALATQNGSISYIHPFLLVAHSTSNLMTLYKVHSVPGEPLTLSKGRDLVGTGASMSSCGVGRHLRMALGLGKAGLHVWDIQNVYSKAIRLLPPGDGTLECDAETQASAPQSTEDMEIVHISEDRVLLREAGSTVTFDFTV
ncbi:hypothetical protein BCR37DRAFT_382274 [Protomyces lactucae-debilis]|uniref:F-box domain-containing protein n=1 Tax=Protomyces lactucae-debilis TaxID=2754530 RepID=A0A1Y2F443_PROLT|nr:uncharacterized protein BCR37DRAFT_382274 [Protomyces lactucae-debilis]ORY78623.1 hypothetical protein BCR37DRAFT_382274 [Protomyces lactucae-debilis]